MKYNLENLIKDFNSKKKLKFIQMKIKRKIPYLKSPI